MAIGISGPDYSLLTPKGIIGSFYDTVEQELPGSWASTLGVTIDSSQSIETYRWLGLPPQLRQWLNGRLVKGQPIRSYTIENQEYEATVGVDRNEMRFDKTGQIMLRISELASQAVKHWEKLCTELLETNGLCWDGQNFFDTDHSMGGENSSTYKNTLTSSEVPSLNVSSATNPTAAEMQDILIGLVQWFYTFKDNSSEPYNGGAKNFVVMVNPAMLGATVAALRVMLGSAGASNQLLVQDFSIRALPNPRLTSTDVIYMFRTDGRMKPLILQNAIPLTMDVLGEGSDRTFMTNQILFGARATRAVGYGQWAYALKATLS